VTASARTESRARPTSPYKGLAPFEDTELDALLFFGREHEREIVAANLVASRLTILYGTSGVGKSSLLRAAVARDLRSLPEQPLVVVHESWVDDPVETLAAAIGAAAGVEGTSMLGDAAEVACALRGELYLILDQLEELFVYHSGEEAEALGRALGELVARLELPVHVLLGVRDDALARLDAFKAHVPGLLANQVRLDHLDRDAGRRAIVGPVERFGGLVPEEEGLAVEPELIEAVLDGVRTGELAPGARGQGVVKGAEGTERVEAPYLQLVMQRLWEVERAEGSRVLRLSVLERLGGPRRIVEEHLERALSALTPDQKALAARMFNHLVTPSGTKISHEEVDLAQYAAASRSELQPVLGVLARERILRAISAGEGAAHEIYHDVLANAVLEWRTRFEAQRELERAREQAERHRRQALRVAALALAALVVVAGIAVFALTQRQDARKQARSSRARALAATALTQLPIDPERSLLLARDAARDSKAKVIETVLRQALIASRVRAIADLHAPVTAVTFAGGSALALAVTEDGRVTSVDAATGRVLSSFATHAPVVALDPTARFALAYGKKGARWYRVADGSPGAPLAAPRVKAVSYSWNGSELVTLHADGTLRVWRLGAGEPRLVIDLPKPPVAAAVSRNGGVVVAATGGRETLVYDGSTGRLVHRMRQPSIVTRLEFGPTAKHLAVVGADKVVRLFHPRRGSLLSTFAGQVGVVTDVAFGPRGGRLAVASTDGSGRIWEVGTADKLVSPLKGHQNKLLTVTFNSNGSSIVTTSTDRTARVWSAKSGEPLALLAGHTDSVTSASFSRGGGRVVTGSTDGTVRFWYPQAQPRLLALRRSKQPVSAARFAGTHVVVAPPGAVDAEVARDGKTWIAAVGTTVVVRRAADGAVLSRFSISQPAKGVALSPDGETVAVTFRHGIARLFSREGRLLRTLHGGRGALLRIAFSPDGRLLAAGSTDNRAKVWDVSRGRLLRDLAGHRDDVLSARFSADGERIVTASRDHDVAVWDTATGTRLVLIRAHFGRVSDAAFSPDGRWIVTAGPGKAGLFDAESGLFVLFLQGHEGPLTSASFSDDGERILTSGEDGTVRMITCDVCGGIDDLARIADRRLAGTHRTLTADERAQYVP
jgi:WD40 repeat protein